MLLGRRVPNPRVFFLLLRRVGNRTEAALDRDRDGSWLRWLMNGDVGRNAGMLLLQALQLRDSDAMREGVGREGFDVITDFCDLDANGDEWGHNSACGLILHNLLRNQAKQPDEEDKEEKDFKELLEHCG